MGILSWLFGDRRDPEILGPRHSPDRQLDVDLERKYKTTPPQKDQTLVQIYKDVKAGVHSDELRKLRDAPDGALVPVSREDILDHFGKPLGLPKRLVSLGPREFDHEFGADYICKWCGQHQVNVMKNPSSHRCRGSESA